MEIEKKFLICKMPGNLEQWEKKEIEQGYLCTSPVVRIRKSNEDYILTYKSREGLEENGEMRVNRETELPLTRESYLHLREKIDGHLIVKTRYLIPLPDGHTGELDVFRGVLEGLVFIEVEFEDLQEAQGFVPPAWFGENVSGDKRYSNSFLAYCDSLDRLKG